jgi:hypothetical protein
VNLLKKHTKAGNAFLIFMTYRLTPGLISYDQLQTARKVLLEFTTTGVPNGKSASTVKNEDYPSIVYGGERVAVQPVPAWRRPPSDFFWQRSPYSLEGSEAHGYSGLDYLISYAAMRGGH